MKNVIMFACLITIMAMGCSKDSIPEDIEAQMNEVIDAVKQPDTRAYETDAIFAHISALSDKQVKIACLRRFVEKTLSIDLSSQGLTNPRRSAVKRLCSGDIIYQSQMSGGTIDDAWDVWISLLSWHRAQADKLYGDGKLPKGLARHGNGGLIVLDYEAKRKYTERRLAYEMVVSNYTMILHMTEKLFPENNMWLGKIDESRIPVLKKKLEKFLGRPMRTSEQCVEDWKNKKSELRKWPR